MLETTTINTKTRMLASDDLINRQIQAVWWVGPYKMSMRLSGDVFVDFTTDGLRVFKQYDGREESVTCLRLKPIPEECKPKGMAGATDSGMACGLKSSVSAASEK